MEKKVINLNKGLFTDTSKSIQPENTTPFALNGQIESLDGDQGYYTNEKGNNLCYSLPEGFIEIGQIQMLDGEFVVFGASSNNSIIGIVNRFCKFTEIIRASCLNFSIKHQITGEFRLRRGCDRTIYFTDNNNVIRTINLDNLDQYKDSLGNWDCDKFSLFREFIHPCFSNITVNNSGGNLDVGTYQFAIQYLDGDLNPTNWITISNVIPVVSDNLNGIYRNVEGGENESTTKSITLNVSNLDEDFIYYRIGVIAHIDGVTNGYIKDFREINSSTSTYLFQDINNDTDIITDPSEFTAPRLSYNTARSIKQIDNKLAIANIKDKKVDWAKFQQKAMEITTEYATKAMHAEDMNHWSPKTFRYYNDTRSYMRDEVYAFGIIWIFTDGSISPAFHIPGRAKITDSTLVSIGNSNIHNRPTVTNNDWDDFQVNPSQDNQHLPLKNSYNRWEVYNTAIRTNINYDPNIFYYTKGELAYYESTELYPDTRDCDGNLIYGTNANTPIRHHKFPDTTLEPHFIAGTVNGTNTDITSFNNVDRIIPIGINFFNIEPPVEYQNDVVGYKIVRAHRTEANSTVIDKGVLHSDSELLEPTSPGHYEARYIRQSYPYYNSSSIIDFGNVLPSTLVENDNFRICDTVLGDTASNKYFSLHSPKSKFSLLSNGDHIKIEREIQGTVIYYLHDESGSNENYLSLVRYNNNHIPAQTITNRFISNQTYIDALSENNGSLSLPFLNENGQETYSIELISNLLHPSNLPENVGSISTYTAPNNTSSNINTHAYYTSIKKYNPVIYGSLSSIIYYETHPCVISKNNKDTVSGQQIIYGGDTFISQLWIRKTFEGADKDDCGESDPSSTTDIRCVFGTWMESTINSELRHEGNLTVNTTLDQTEQCNEGYYPKTFGENTYIQEGRTRAYLDRNSSCINTYLYNDVFSKENEIKIHFPLPITFRFCNKCLNEYKNRIAVSQTSFQEESIDNYRVFLANNYKDVGSNTGEITNLINKNNKLYIHTENSLFYQDIKPQNLRSDQAILYVGTGEALEQPSYEVTTSDGGYAGSINKISTLNTPYGVFFVSHNDRKVFSFSERLDEISNKGISNWLQNNITLIYRDQIKKILDLNIDPDNPVNTYGIGFTSAFDKLNDRIIISKKDYKFIDESLIKGYYDSELNSLQAYDLNGNIINQQINSIYYDNVNGYLFKRINASIKTIISFDDPIYFENKSWTLTYNIKFQTWVSYHSYLPHHLFSINDKVYSHIGTKDVYEHNSGEYLKYYNSYKPFILEHVITKNYLQTQTYPSIQFLCDVTKDNVNYNETFNKCWMYNDYQSTGILSLSRKDLTPFASVTSSNNVFVDRNEREWSINKYRDIIDQPINPQSIFSIDWSSISNDYYIDKIPNQNIHNINKSVFSKERMRDVYMVARMIYETEDNKKIQPRFLLPIVKDSPR